MGGNGPALVVMQAASRGRVVQTEAEAERAWKRLDAEERARVTEVVGLFFNEGGAAAQAKSAARPGMPSGMVQLRATHKLRVWLAPMGNGEWTMWAIPFRNDRRFYSRER